MCVPEMTDCHDDLIEYAGVDGTECVRVRFTPPDIDDLIDPDRYELLIVQATVPEWFDHQMQARTEDALRDRVRAMIVTDTRSVILSGCWIVARYGHVGDVVAGRIVHVAPGGVVRNVLDGAVIDDVYGTVIDVQAGGVVHSVRGGGTIINVWGTIANVWGVIGNVWPGGRIEIVWQGGTVGTVRSGGTISEMRGTVGDVWGKIVNVWGVAGNVWQGGIVVNDLGTVGNVRRGGTVGIVREGGTVGSVREGGTVDSVRNGSTVGSMVGSVQGRINYEQH